MVYYKIMKKIEFHVTSELFHLRDCNYEEKKNMKDNFYELMSHGYFSIDKNIIFFKDKKISLNDILLANFFWKIVKSIKPLKEFKKGAIYKNVFANNENAGENIYMFDNTYGGEINFLTDLGSVSFSEEKINDFITISSKISLEDNLTGDTFSEKPPLNKIEILENFKLKKTTIEKTLDKVKHEKIDVSIKRKNNIQEKLSKIKFPEI